MPPRTRAATKRGAKTARTAVFSTTGKLEQIPLQLPQKDIILSTRVSRHWSLTIVTSLPIQRALFMSPEPVCQILRQRDGADVARIHKDDHSKEFRGADRGVIGGYDFIPAQANPLLAKMDPPFSYECLTNRVEVIATALFLEGKDTRGSVASWQRMFLTQHPETDIIFMVREAEETFSSSEAIEYKHVVLEQGVRMGDVVDAMRECKQKVVHQECLYLSQMRVAEGEELELLHTEAGGEWSRPWTEKERLPQGYGAFSRWGEL